MSVLARNRKESEMEVVQNARETQEEIIRICMNEKYFPKRYRFVLVLSIIKKVTKMTDNVIGANSIFPRDQEDLKMRRKYQRKALAKCAILLNKLELASKLFPIPEGIQVDLTRRIVKEENLIQKWKKSDKERFKF